MELDTDQKEQLRWREVIRLMQATQDESVENLLSVALAGRETSVASVTKLYHFVLRHFGDTDGFTPSTVSRKFWQAASAYFTNEGLTQEEQLKIKNPYPKAGEPGFRSVLEEFEQEGLT
jgi:hypothetical protein